MAKPKKRFPFSLISRTITILTFKVFPEDMVWVEGGSFRMGSNNIFDVDSSPQHKVTVSDFCIGKYPVTQGQYQKLMGNNPSYFKGSRAVSRQEEDTKRPVEQLSWFDAIEYCNKLSEACGLEPVYKIGSRLPKTGPISSATIETDWSRDGYRLPTEAEWEYAARGGKFQISFTYSAGNSLDEMAWLSANSGGKTHEVGKKMPNSLGIFDMCGNVWEWCWDLYGHYGSEAQMNPTGVPEGSTRVTRGGGWSYLARDTLLSYRGDAEPSSRFNALGFRVARSM